MDDIQKILVKMIKEQPSCINDRKQLRAVLLDYIPQNKLQQNLILNAYDEDIAERLKSSSDVTLHALQMVKNLSDGYGLTKDSAMWSVVSWCHMLNLTSIAEVLCETVSQNTVTSNNHLSSGNIYTLKSGTYKPGIDFQPGEILVINTTENDTSLFGVWWGIGKNPAKVRADADGHHFHDRIYLHVSEDEYLKIDGEKNTTVTVQKIGD